MYKGTLCGIAGISIRITGIKVFHDRFCIKCLEVAGDMAVIV